jgi:O-antigen/teichoic acid export membrane protein
LAISLWFAAPYIANEWLQSQKISPNQLIFVIQLMGASIALQLPANLYVGGLMGLEKQVVANVIQVLWSMLRGVGSILVLWQISPSITAFIWWQLFSNVIYCLVARKIIWCEMREPRAVSRFKWTILRNNWRFAAGMAGMSFVSISLLQLDKLIVSKLLPLEMLGYYMLAATLASITGILARPIVRALFPQFTALVEEKERASLVKLYHNSSEFLSLATIPAGLICIFFSRELLFIWTGSSVVAEQSWLVASLLVSGALMQSLTAVPFYVALAHGELRLNLKVGLVSIILLVPLLFLLIPGYGLVGAGMSWFMMNVVIFIPYMYFIHSRFLPGEFLNWIFRSIVQPLGCALPIIIIGYVALLNVESRLLSLVNVGLIWFLATLAIGLVMPKFRRILLKNIRYFFGFS